MPNPTDVLVRLTTSPVVSIAKIRGRVRGVGSEFVLACDMRFDSRDHTIMGQPEVGAGVIPGAGGTARLPMLIGRGGALEIILGANDFDGEPLNATATSTTPFQTMNVGSSGWVVSVSVGTDAAG